MSAYYTRSLDLALGARLRVQFTTDLGRGVNYAVVLMLVREGIVDTIRVFDGAHGRNEMHRYTRGGGKQPAEVFHDGTLGEGMRVAIRATEDGYLEMINGWLSS